MLGKILQPVKTLFSSIFKDENGYVSRKLIAAWVLTLIILIALAAHYIAFFWMIEHAREELMYLQPLLSGEQFAIVISAIWGGYFAANVGARYLSKAKTLPGDEGED